MKLDTILPDSILEMGVSTNLNCSSIKSQKFRSSIITHKINEALAYIFLICTFQMIGCVEARLVAIDLASNIASQSLTLCSNHISSKLAIQTFYTKLPVSLISSTDGN